MNYAGLTDFVEIVIVTLIFSDVSTIKITFVFCAFQHRNLSVALLHFHFVTLFSFQGAASDFAIRFEDPIPWVFKSNNKLSFGGPKWTRTTDLTIISRVL